MNNGSDDGTGSDSHEEDGLMDGIGVALHTVAEQRDAPILSRR